MNQAHLLWSFLNVLTKVRYDALMEVYGSLEDAAKHVGEELLRGLGCREETVRDTLMKMEEWNPSFYARRLDKSGTRFLTIADAEYPSRLREIGDPPVFLYARGDLSILDQPCIALVGTRGMSQYGRRVTGDLVPDFVSAGMVTVSGLAEGIDAEVAVQTLKAGGRTVAVLGHGLATIYPRDNAELAEEIIEAGGLLLSEFPFDFPPDKYTFPSRNRIVAGLTLGTVVLEAPEGSGAIITADLANDYGRDVFAVPGSIYDANYAGCAELIRKGHARLITSASQALQELGIIAPEHPVSSYEPQTEEEGKIMAVLTTMPQSMDDLAGRSALDAGTLNAALTMMELQGAVKNVGGGQWVRA
ncbi:MAG: DNA processing protein [Candidatus Peregrinibacteria bacterium Greene0416_19]|nr:MAG: DNA processing protein [Candidatus Peregrinibacteria bacterium Greene0416_19]